MGIEFCCEAEKSTSKSLRDGRIIYVGGQRIDDVTRHPAFRGAAETVAAI